MLPARLSIDKNRRRRLVDVALDRTAPDAVFVTDRMVDVYCRTIRPAAIATAEGRIAWVRDPAETNLQDLTTITLDGTVVPGLVEPHCHPDIVYSPSALAGELARHGTSTVCADTAFLSLRLGDTDLKRTLVGMSSASVKFLWNLRPCLDGVLPVELERMRAERLIRLTDELPDLVGTGEMTAWPDLLNADPRLTSVLDAAIKQGLRVDGHAAGTSPRTLGALAAAGVTADHEAITSEELIARCRLGHWVMLRHSSLRPDARALSAAIISGDVPTSRVMLTTDGPVAADVMTGHLDTVVREVVAAGVDPLDAIRMASLNPAIYYGLDAHIGGIAPGRTADLLVVDSARNFTPQQVVLEGIPMVGPSIEHGFSKWQQLETDPFVAALLSPNLIVDECLAGPSLRLSGIITRLVDRHDVLPANAAYLALVARDGSWIVGATVENIAISALASTFSGSGDVLLVGRDPDRLTEIYQRVIERGGGIATKDRTVPLDVLGSLFDGSMQQLDEQLAPLVAELDMPAGLPPLEYMLLFFTIGVLPDVRLTPVGAIDVKTREILRAPSPLQTR